MDAYQLFATAALLGTCAIATQTSMNMTSLGPEVTDGKQDMTLSSPSVATVSNTQSSLGMERKSPSTVIDTSQGNQDKVIK